MFVYTLSTSPVQQKKCDYIEMCAVWYLQHAGEGSKEIQDMEIRCWNNVAAAQLKVAIAVTVNI